MVLPVHRLRTMYMTYVVAAEVVPVPAQLGVEGTARPQLHALRTWQTSCSVREPRIPPAHRMLLIYTLPIRAWKKLKRKAS